MPYYRFIMSNPIDSFTVEATNLAAAYTIHEFTIRKARSSLQHVECNVPPNPARLETFDLEIEDLRYRIEPDKEEASGDDWHEPRVPAHAFPHRVWYSTNFHFPDLGQWVEIVDPERAFNKGTYEYITEKCEEYCFPERD